MNAHVTALRAELVDAIEIARKVDPMWRTQIIDLLRSAINVIDEIQSPETYRTKRAWSDLQDAIVTMQHVSASADALERIGIARMVYLGALCEAVREDLP